VGGSELPNPDADPLANLRGDGLAVDHNSGH
jgi:hypothetical protein